MSGLLRKGANVFNLRVFSRHGVFLVKTHSSTPALSLASLHTLS